MASRRFPSPGCVVYSCFVVIGLIVGIVSLFFAFFESDEANMRTKFFLIAANALTLILVTLHFQSILGTFSRNNSPRKSVSCAPPIHFVIALCIGASLFSTPTEPDTRGTGFLVTSLIALLAHLFSVIAYIAAKLDKASAGEQNTLQSLVASEAGITDTNEPCSTTSRRLIYPGPVTTLEFFQILLGQDFSRGSASVGHGNIPVISHMLSPPNYTEVAPQEDCKPPNYADIEKETSEDFSVDMPPPLDPPHHHGSCSPNIPPSPPPAYSLFTAD